MLLFQFKTLVIDQLDKSGLAVTEHLKLLLLSVVAGQFDDDSVNYRNAVGEAGLYRMAFFMGWNGLIFFESF